MRSNEDPKFKRKKIFKQTKRSNCLCTRPGSLWAQPSSVYPRGALLSCTLCPAPGRGSWRARLVSAPPAFSCFLDVSQPLAAECLRCGAGGTRCSGRRQRPPLWGLVPFCSVSRPHPPLPPQIAKPPPPLLSTVFISILQACQPPSSFSP